jgi:hypothetical protein
MAGVTIFRSSSPNRPPSPACGLTPLTAMRGCSIASLRKVSIGARNPFTRNQLQGARNAGVQRHMRDAYFAPLVLEAQHQDAVFRRESRHPGDEGRVAVELEAGGVDRAFGVGRGHHRLILAGERAADGGFRRIEGRTPVGGIDHSDSQLPGFELLSLDQLDALERQAAPLRVRLQDTAVPDYDRTTDRPHPRVERSLEADLRADPRRVAGGDGDSELVARHDVPTNSDD